MCDWHTTKKPSKTPEKQILKNIWTTQYRMVIKIRLKLISELVTSRLETNRLKGDAR